MRPNVLLCLFLAAVLLLCAACPAKAQPIPRQPELADQIDQLFDRASTPANQQKFYSILIFALFGGASTYCVMRGIRKVVTIY